MLIKKDEEGIANSVDPVLTAPLESVCSRYAQSCFFHYVAEIIYYALILIYPSVFLF